MRKLTVLLIATILALGCSKKEESNPVVLSGENKILSFNITDEGETFVGIINQSTKTISVTTSNIDLSSLLIPTIEISENSNISPLQSTPQNFSDFVSYTVTAENGDEAVYEVDVKSDDNKILNFSLTYDNSTYTAEIDHETKIISIETIGLESQTTLVPEMTISSLATISPDITVAQNFNENVSYTVTSDSNEQTTYTVEVSNTPYSNEKKILSFQFVEDGVTFDGIINHDDLTIHIESYKNIINITPVMTISDGATISPDGNNTQDFRSDIPYTVTAQDGSTNTYIVYSKGFSIFSMNSARNTTNLVAAYYTKATPFVRCTYVDLTLPNAVIVLENDSNSYELSTNDYSSNIGSTFGVTFTYFEIELPDDIVTANNYKLQYKVDGILKAESDFFIDVVSDNVPDIISSNQTIYNSQDSLTLTGVNLVPGLRIVTSNGSIYQFNSANVLLNPEATMLTIENLDNQLFPSYYGNPPFLTAVILFANGRYGETIWVTFD